MPFTILSKRTEETLLAIVLKLKLGTSAILNRQIFTAIISTEHGDSEDFKKLSKKLFQTRDHDGIRGKRQ